MPEPVIALRSIAKTYRMGGMTVTALASVGLEIYRGEMVAIMGPSGSGKSTLMNILGCLDRPTAGEYHLADRAVARLGDDQLADVRNRFIGFVFQSYNLLPRLSALQNVELPLIYRGDSTKRRRQAALEALAEVGLAERVHHLPMQLSGGQQQRVAVARALVGQPAILLADEPTGNLDSRNGDAVMQLLTELHRKGSTICMVTHDARYAALAQRSVRLFDGRIVDEDSFQRLTREDEARLEAMVDLDPGTQP